MKSIHFLIIMILFVVAILFSCRKEFSCENCLPGNQAPVADAGKDTLIKLLDNTALLNGGKSFDPDGTIRTYQWEKISGPGSFSLVTPTQPSTRAEQLLEGVYQFELTVTDDGGLSAKDTVVVSVIDPTIPNRAPVADAGRDQVINNITEPVYLNGSASSDPENNISAFHWVTISGPGGVTFASPNDIAPSVTLTQEGVYLFELTVTDSAGLSSKDTVQVWVDFSVVCDDTNRRVVNVNLVPVGKLSEARVGLVAATAGTKILFACGLNEQSELSGRVDIFDFAQNTWEQTDLFETEREGVSAVSLGNKIFLAGGGNSRNGSATARVDVYDVVTKQWSVVGLSEERLYMGAAAAGNKIYFSGGAILNNGIYSISDLVEIYDTDTKTLSKDKLSEPRVYHSTNVAGNKIYFAGGQTAFFPEAISKRVDIQDATSNTWSTAEMKEQRMGHAGLVFQNRIFWASGITDLSGSGSITTPSVEIKDLTTGLTRFNCIDPRSGFKAVVKDNMIVFFTGSRTWTTIDRIDIYDTVTGEWFIGKLPGGVYYSEIIVANNKIYVAGGTYNAIQHSDQVWTLEW